MTKLLDQGIEAVRALSTERQDMAGDLLLGLADERPRYRLAADQVEDLRLGREEANRGEYATEDKMAGTWKKFGL